MRQDPFEGVTASPRSSIAVSVGHAPGERGDQAEADGDGAEGWRAPAALEPEAEGTESVSTIGRPTAGAVGGAAIAGGAAGEGGARWTFANAADQFLHDTLSALVVDIETFAKTEVAEVRRRLSCPSGSRS